MSITNIGSCDCCGGSGGSGSYGGGLVLVDTPCLSLIVPGPTFVNPCLLNNGFPWSAMGVECATGPADTLFRKIGANLWTGPAYRGFDEFTNEPSYWEIERVPLGWTLKVKTCASGSTIRFWTSPEGDDFIGGFGPTFNPENAGGTGPCIPTEAIYTARGGDSTSGSCGDCEAMYPSNYDFPTWLEVEFSGVVNHSGQCSFENPPNPCPTRNCSLFNTKHYLLFCGGCIWQGGNKIATSIMEGTPQDDGVNEVPGWLTELIYTGLNPDVAFGISSNAYWDDGATLTRRAVATYKRAVADWSPTATNVMTLFSSDSSSGNGLCDWPATITVSIPKP